MGDAAGKLAERIHLLRFRELRLDALQRRFGLAALGDVAGNLGEPDQRAVVPADRIDDDTCPEIRAVLAHAPAFGRKASLAQCRFERTGWPARRAILWGIKGFERFADDFIR